MCSLWMHAELIKYAGFNEIGKCFNEIGATDRTGNQCEWEMNDTVSSINKSEVDGMRSIFGTKSMRPNNNAKNSQP